MPPVLAPAPPNAPQPTPLAPSRPADIRLRAHRSPLILWHLLSLDAPTVAVLWTVFLARLSHTPLPFATCLSLALAVWILYAADRLLDAAHPARAHHRLEPRHYIHRRHSSRFLPAIVLAALALAALLPRLPTAALHLYVAEASLIALYFVLIHMPVRTSPPHRARIPKELLVGPFFAAATFIPTVAPHPHLATALLPRCLLFAAVCILNCLYIYSWEHPPAAPAGPRPHPASAFALRHLPRLTVLVLAAAVLLPIATRNRLQTAIYTAACAGTTILLLALHRRRATIPALTLRAAADAALLTPLLLLCFLP